MAFPTILILGLFTLSISIITCGFAQHASEVTNVPGESETVINPDENERSPVKIPWMNPDENEGSLAKIPWMKDIIFHGGNYLPTGSITEISYEGKVIIKKFTCPAIYGLYPHPGSCEYYFECRFGYPTLWHCDRGYLYDREKGQCGDKRRVQCHIGRDRDHDRHRDGKDKEIDVEEDVSYFKCPYMWGKFAHPYDCSKYFVCIHNHPKLFQCYRDFLYDTHIRKCLPSKRVKCGNRLDRDQMRTSRRPATLPTTIKPVEITRVTRKYPYSEKTTGSPTFSTLTPSTVRELPETTTSEKPVELTTTSASTTTVTPSTTTTPAPTTRTTVPTPTTSTTTTSVPTTTTTTPTTSTPIPTTRAASTTTSAPQTTTVSSEATTIGQFSTIIPVTKPNTPPPTDCDEEDLDCIIDDTGDVTVWFQCPRRFGHFSHGSSERLFIHCDNWMPLVKKCAKHTRFSLIYNVCTREE